MKAINIKWDLEDDVVDYNIDDCDIPTMVDIPNDIKEEDVADYLSDEYGFCVESFRLVKDFEELTAKELWKLRKEVVVGSMFVSDYVNTFGFNPHDVSSFFDGYADYLQELIEEDGVDESEFYTYDNINNLWSWFNCYDDLSWIGFDEDCDVCDW